MISVPSNIAPHLVLTHPFQGVHGWFDRELLPCNQERLLWNDSIQGAILHEGSAEVNWIEAYLMPELWKTVLAEPMSTCTSPNIEWLSTTDRAYWYPQVARNNWQALLPQQSTWSSVASTTCTGGGGHGQDLFHPKQAAWAAPHVRFSLHLISIYIDLRLQMIGVWRNKCRSFLMIRTQRLKRKRRWCTKPSYYRKKNGTKFWATRIHPGAFCLQRRDKKYLHARMTHARYSKSLELFWHALPGVPVLLACLHPIFLWIAKDAVPLRHGWNSDGEQRVSENQIIINHEGKMRKMYSWIDVRNVCHFRRGKPCRQKLLSWWARPRTKISVCKIDTVYSHQPCVLYPHPSPKLFPVLRTRIPDFSTSFTIPKDLALASGLLSRWNSRTCVKASGTPTLYCRECLKTQNIQFFIILLFHEFGPSHCDRLEQYLKL